MIWNKKIAASCQFGIGTHSSMWGLPLKLLKLGLLGVQHQRQRTSARQKNACDFGFPIFGCRSRSVSDTGACSDAGSALADRSTPLGSNRSDCNSEVAEQGENQYDTEHQSTNTYPKHPHSRLCAEEEMTLEDAALYWASCPAFPTASGHKRMSAPAICSHERSSADGTSWYPTSIGTREGAYSSSSQPAPSCEDVSASVGLVAAYCDGQAQLHEDIDGIATLGWNRSQPCSREPWTLEDAALYWASQPAFPAATSSSSSSTQGPVHPWRR